MSSRSQPVILNSLMLIDSHAHLDFYNDHPTERDQVLVRAFEAGVRTILAIGIGVIIIGIVFAIVRRSRGIERDTGFSSYEAPPPGPTPPGPPPPGPGATS